MIPNKFDIKKFSIAQMTSNSNGKTSASGAMGCLLCTVGALCFLVGTFNIAFMKDPQAELLYQSIIVITIGAGLLGYRKSVAGTSENVGNGNSSVSTTASSTSTKTVTSTPTTPTMVVPVEPKNDPELG